LLSWSTVLPFIALTAAVTGGGRETEADHDHGKDERHRHPALAVKQRAKACLDATDSTHRPQHRPAVAAT